MIQRLNALIGYNNVVITGYNNVVIYLSMNLAKCKQRERKHLNNQFNPLQPGVAFLYSLKTSENLKAFGCFQGV